MKKTLLILVLSLTTIASYGQNKLIDLADSFLKKHVQDGKVDYQSIKSNPVELFEMLNIIALEEIPEADNKAYLINAYNLLVIASVVDAYPILSPQDVPGFFDNKVHVVANKKMSLNYLEKELLFKVYEDPRMHFILVCGALGCPPITNFAYKTDGLDAQLNMQTVKALNSDFIKVDDEKKLVQLSEIFKWYASDFGGNNKAVISYINSYRDNKIPDNYRVDYYKYYWQLNGLQTKAVQANNNGDNIEVGSTNLQTFTAGSLLRKNQYDLTVFNTLYTQQKENWLGQDVSGYRSTFVTNLVQITYGVTKNKRVNLGLDLNFRYNGIVRDNDALSGISEAFRFTNDATSRAGLASVGLRARLQPFKEVPDFTMQTTFQMPTMRVAEGNGDLFWADWDRITWWNQFFYTKNFSKFQLFAEIDLLFRFRRFENQIGMLDMPMSVFFSYFPTSKITLYAMSQHVPRFTNAINPDVQNDWIVPSNFTASGIGAKYQFSSQMNIELLYTNFWRGVNSGLGSTVNIGLKFISK